MELGMKGDVAVVTGSASGIGWACAQSLAREGCSVALWDLSPEVDEKAASLTHQFGNASLGKRVDISAGGSGAIRYAGNGSGVGLNLSSRACGRDGIRQIRLSLYQPGTG